MSGNRPQDAAANGRSAGREPGRPPGQEPPQEHGPDSGRAFGPDSGPGSERAFGPDSGPGSERAFGPDFGRGSGRVFGRREALGVAGVAVCGLALTGCGSGGSDPGRAPGIKGKVIARTADVPVGGGKVVDQYKIVVTQPSEGVYKAFSAICPHRGCAVGSPENDVMTCPCHGSEFAADTGKCLKGPATGPLTPYQVKVEGDGIVVV